MNILIFTTKLRKNQLILKQDSVNLHEMMKTVIRRTCAYAFKVKIWGVQNLWPLPDLKNKQTFILHVINLWSIISKHTLKVLIVPFHST